MREALWPGTDEAALHREMRTIAADEDQAVRLAENDDGCVVGFAELAIHAHAIGCRTHPVAYLEGWYVDAAQRRRGIGRALLTAAESWACGKGCTEIASDTWLDNATSITAHQRLGFEECGRLAQFRKGL